jgi:hypothetical protein
VNIFAPALGVACAALCVWLMLRTINSWERSISVIAGRAPCSVFDGFIADALAIQVQENFHNLLGEFAASVIIQSLELARGVRR